MLELKAKFMTYHEHMELLEKLGKEFQQKLIGVDPNDTAAIARLETEFHQQVLGAGREFQPKVRITRTPGGNPRLEWD